jgi:tetratricopeptide (TPR) repeat protein
MRPRNFKNRHTIFQLTLKYEQMLECGNVFFQQEHSYFELINYYEHECLLEKALEVAEFAIRQYPYSTEFFLRKAELLLQTKELEQALATLDRVDALAPGSLLSSLVRAEGLAALGMQDEAIYLLDGLKDLAMPEELSEILVCESLIYEQMREYERMFYVLKAALEANPSNAEALSRMWFCVEHAQKYEESVILHEKILEDDPFNALSWYNLGAANHYLCNHEEAIQAYEYAYLTKEDFEFAYRDCAEVCLYIQDYQKALQCYQEVLDRFEPDADLFLHIGLCYQRLGNFLVARTFHERAVEYDYYCDEAHFHIGECYAKQKEWQKAISAFLKAIRIEEGNEEYFFGLAEAYYQTGNLKKAEMYFREAADTAPEDSRYWIRLVQFLMERHRADEALEVLDEAEENSFDPELLYCRSACLFELGQKQAALLVLEEALFEDFEAHNSLFHLLPVLEKDIEVQAVISIFQPE